MNIAPINNKSTAGYLLIQMWKLYEEGQPQLAQDIGEDDRMSALMEVAQEAAEMIDKLIDWPAFNCGVFDYEYADRNDSGSLARALWDGWLAENSVKDSVALWLSSNEIPLKPLPVEDQTTQELLSWMGRSYLVPADRADADRFFTTIQECGAAKLKIREIEMEQNALVAKGQSGVDLHRAAELAEASSSVTKAHWYLQQYQAH